MSQRVRRVRVLAERSAVIFHIRRQNDMPRICLTRSRAPTYLLVARPNSDVGDSLAVPATGCDPN